MPLFVWPSKILHHAGGEFVGQASSCRRLKKGQFIQLVVIIVYDDKPRHVLVLIEPAKYLVSVSGLPAA